jgi:ankyrin repeat protein/tetratricopeptide (TPR) repeat protein
MKTSIAILVVGLLSSGLRAADAPNSALQKGLFEEEANQNLNAAIAAYQSVLAAHEDERKLAATALFRLGECYRKLGRTNDAVAQYQRLIRDYSDVGTLATLSRQNLTGLGVQNQASGKSEATPAQLEANRLLVERLELEIKSTEGKLARQKDLIRQNIAPQSSDDEIEARLLELRRQMILARDAGPTSTTDSAGVSQSPPEALSPATRAQLKELLQQELKIAEQFAAEQRKKVETGTLAPGDQVRFERDVLGLKRQLVAADGLSSNEDRQQWRELLQQEIKLAEEAVKFEKQKLDSGKSVASEVARLQRDVLILKRELVTFEATPALPAASSAPRSSATSTLTDEEEKEIRRIQALIRDSPDLINAAADNNWTPLHRAAWNGQLVVARFLLENGANVDQPSGTERKTALVLAAAQGHKSMVELLLARGASPNAKEEYGNMALHEAAAKGFVTVVEVLLANKAELESRNNSGETPLHRAASAGQAGIAETLLKRGANANAARNNGDTPLHLAAERGDVRTIDVLLKNKADVNAKNKIEVPPLGEALAHGWREAVQTLLENGATTDFVLAGGSPVHTAVGRDSIELVQLLLKHKAAPDRPNSRGLTPLQSVVIDPRNQRKPELIPLLIKAGANPNTPLPASAKITIRERTGSSDRFLPQYPILIAAIMRRDLPQVEALLANGADVNAFAPDGNYQSTAVMFAIYYDSLELMEALLRHKPNLESTTRNEGRTALHQATARAEKSGVDFVEALIKAGSKVDAVDNKGWTPLHVAAWDGKPEVVSALLQAGANPNIHAQDGALPLSLARRTSGSTVLSESVRQEISKLLLEHGADESLLRRRTISVTRRGQNYERVIFRRGTNDLNRHTLDELISTVYGPGPAEKQYVSFPDLRQIAIERVDGVSRTRQILVDVEARAMQGSCTNDFLEWGDRVEIRETEHPLNANWPGLDGTIATNISRCLGRRVELVVKARTNRTELRASALFANQTFGPDGRHLNGHGITHDSFRLGEVLRRSGLLLTTSDLARVRVRRRDPVTSKPQEWIIDETKPDPETDLWVRDGDVIEVPER